MTLRAIVAGDAEPFLDALVTLVLDLEDRLEVVGWARDQEEAVLLASRTCPDIALVSARPRPSTASRRHTRSSPPTRRAA